MKPAIGPFGTGTPSTVRPARLITYAWGERYLDDLLSITLPAALAPGNLPYLAAMGPCEVVLLTEEKFMSMVDRHPTVQRIRRFCPLHLVGLDDLVHAKDKYGMTLTYALHRGLIDLGSVVTESYLFFLNADFVVAENCFRAVLGNLRDGKRLIAAPSYCVNYGSVAPTLRRRVSAATGALAISHRELADLALRNLHNTVRGKTLNQRKFHLKQIDQFYWQVDAHTLLGHQMPVAIVGMRPERQVAEPNSFWDHGLIREFFPLEEPHILGDSDDFLMIELRERDVAREQIARGPTDPQDAGERMVGWVTPYQRSFARYQLTLHSRDLPPEIEGERAALSARMNAILSFCPAFLPSHREHPQWNYHLGPFMAARHRYLSERLGPLIDTEQPPASCLPIDRVWWQLYGAAKRHQLKKADLERVRDRHLSLLDEQTNSLSRALAIREKEANRRFMSEFATISDAPSPGQIPTTNSHGAFFDGRIEKPSCGSELTGYAGTLRKYQREFEFILAEWDTKTQALGRMRDTARIYYARELQQIAERSIREIAQLEGQYARSTRMHVTSALVPRVRLHKPQDGQVARRTSVGIIKTLAAWVRNRFYRGPTKRIRQMLSSTGCGESSVILVVTGSDTWVDQEALRFPGTSAAVTMADLLSGNLVSAIDPAIKFDLCLCELAPGQLFSLDKLASAVAACLKPKARILGLYWHTLRAPLLLDGLRSPDGLLLRFFVDQYSPVTAYLARGLDALYSLRFGHNLLHAARRGIKHTHGSFRRSLTPNIVRKRYLPFRKGRVERYSNVNLATLGTVVTVELVPTIPSYDGSTLELRKNTALSSR